MSESQRVRQQKADLIIPTRWVRTNKHDGLEGKPSKAKSRLVVQGFKDKSLGQYRRDAPTASAMAESLCLAICAYMHFTMVAKDVKNAYFSGRSVNREIYLDQPRGGLPGLRPGQLLRARKAIYRFCRSSTDVFGWPCEITFCQTAGWSQNLNQLFSTCVWMAS